jgi:hypothetical protein
VEHGRLDVITEKQFKTLQNMQAKHPSPRFFDNFKTEVQV